MDDVHEWVRADEQCGMTDDEIVQHENNDRDEYEEQP
ncbi:hypothetical protein AVEN_231351-1, partial [Araneus ventricosus]